MRVGVSEVSRCGYEDLRLSSVEGVAEQEGHYGHLGLVSIFGRALEYRKY